MWHCISLSQSCRLSPLVWTMPDTSFCYSSKDLYKFLYCSQFLIYILSSTTLADLSSSFSNFLFNFTKKSLADMNSNSSASKFSKIFSFQMSTNLSYTYVSIYWTCSSTFISLILILIYNLHVVTNSLPTLLFY